MLFEPQSRRNAFQWPAMMLVGISNIAGAHFSGAVSWRSHAKRRSHACRRPNGSQTCHWVVEYLGDSPLQTFSGQAFFPGVGSQLALLPPAASDRRAWAIAPASAGAAAAAAAADAVAGATTVVAAGCGESAVSGIDRRLLVCGC